MRTLLLLLVLALTTACGQNDHKDTAPAQPAPDAPKWTADEVASSVFSCENSLTTRPGFSGSANGGKSTIYCGCMAEESSKRWTLEEFTQRPSHLDELKADGTVTKCKAKAGVTE